MSKVTVNVPQEKAFERAETQWGDLPVDNFEDILKALSVEERMFLKVSSEVLYVLFKESAYVGWERKIIADSTSTEDVVLAIRKILEELKDKEKGEKQKAETELDKILKTSENFINERTFSRGYSDSTSKIQELAKTAEKDPEVYEKVLNETLEVFKNQWEERTLEALRNGEPPKVNGQVVYFTELKSIAEKHESKPILEILKAKEEVEAKEREEKEAQKEASRLVWLEWAKEHGSEDLKLAIEDGYPLGQAVEMQVLDYLFPEETENLTARFSVESNEDRRVPNKRAREAQAYLEQQVKKASIAPEGTEVSVGRIKSVKVYAEHDCEDKDYCDECDDDGEMLTKRTAVPVTVKAVHHEVTRWYLIKEE